MDDSTRIAEIRRFSRAFTRWLERSDEPDWQTAPSPAEARLIEELNAAGEASAADLSRAMGVDPAYMSRMLHKLAAQGLVSTTPATDDRRRNLLALTPAGRDLFARQSRLADESVARRIAPLSEGERAEMASAMQTIRRILEHEDERAAIVLRPHRIGDVAHVVARQSVIYAKDYGWDGSYEALAAEIAGRFLQEFDPAIEGCWIAERGGRIVGSVFVVDAGDGIAQLRLLYVEPEARGLGVGRLLVDQVVAFARDRGYRKVRLWTQSELVAARRVYAAAGFMLVESRPHHSFGRDLVGEYWELPLQAAAAQ